MNIVVLCTWNTRQRMPTQSCNRAILCWAFPCSSYPIMRHSVSNPTIIGCAGVLCWISCMNCSTTVVSTVIVVLIVVLKKGTSWIDVGGHGPRIFLFSLAVHFGSLLGDHSSHSGFAWTLTMSSATIRSCVQPLPCETVSSQP